ncbi:MAG: tetratricopeptide repeat protein [Chloroflexota bacterium]
MPKTGNLCNLGNAYRNLGKVQESITYIQQALAIARKISDRRGEGNRLSADGNQLTQHSYNHHIQYYSTSNWSKLDHWG